ncbi:hypothetical protein [Leucobacter luti]|uniref:hypothetical protein n=1 Tax=Leucobacter luti TaxID=340320 RepID=UPI001C68B2E9|nr:hypothetical protein [Leucobacter luti]QYM76954.1 hypothetical protein K1X41_06155 [Leucobacter luti]
MTYHSTHMTRDAAKSQRATLRTPYHSLGNESEMRVPGWAQHRSVYRTSGRTLYLVETDRPAEARRDLERLTRSGWDVRVEPAAAGELTRIALTRSDLARAA